MTEKSLHEQAVEAQAKARYEQSCRERWSAGDKTDLWKPPSWDDLEPRSRYSYIKKELAFSEVRDAFLAERGWKLVPEKPVEGMPPSYRDAWAIQFDAAPSPKDVR